MAVLTHDGQYPCLFELSLLEWERYTAGADAASARMAELGKPYTLWVKYRMRLQIGDSLIYGSQKDTTLMMEDIGQLVEELKQLVGGKKHRIGFDPTEPDFGLVIRNLTESDTTVMVSSAADPPATPDTSYSSHKGFDISYGHNIQYGSARQWRAGIRAEVPTDATNQSRGSSGLFDVNVWIDYPNQVDRIYGGYGPGLYFYTGSKEIERFSDELQEDLDRLGAYFTEKSTE